MTKNIKVIAALIVAGLFLATAFRTEAYPPFVRKSEKFGAKDCLFCHTEPQGGEGWNDRGKWLMTEKDKRKADSIDVEWLAEYKAADTATTGEKKEGEGEKKPETENKDKENQDKDKAKEKDKPKKPGNGNN